MEKTKCILILEDEFISLFQSMPNMISTISMHLGQGLLFSVNGSMSNMTCRNVVYDSRTTFQICFFRDKPEFPQMGRNHAHLSSQTKVFARNALVVSGIALPK